MPANCPFSDVPLENATYIVTLRSAMMFWKSMADTARDSSVIRHAEGRYIINRNWLAKWEKP